MGTEQMRTVTWLLGAHQDGYWPWRLIEDRALAAAGGQPLINRTGPNPSVDWNAVGLLMLASGRQATASRSELAMLKVAASLVPRCLVQLGQVIHAADAREFPLILQALSEAAHGI
ncbi:hypothetical protein [Streptomyces sp. NBC_01262]|uniref:hypothetical protein n=1 Tax=Streptomyces sp. NBC_01262 TaxID=2903803 RepID=UPI002E333EC3|nr:hypothetical protein [Streptomyces sp. NBC_01262]